MRIKRRGLLVDVSVRKPSCACPLTYRKQAAQAAVVVASSWIGVEVQYGKREKIHIVISKSKRQWRDYSIGVDVCCLLPKASFHHRGSCAARVELASQSALTSFTPSPAGFGTTHM